ncbi:MAG TPA: hypothetical protein VHZ54_03120 [Solirubrobacterales bacterium]|jgi:hypothetical protein|nr:hypothetical protein [Solirubrobacterales bacterium]
MKTKILLVTAIASCVGLCAAGAASGAFVAIYRNALETTAQRSEVLKLSGQSCTRGGGQTSLKITVGKLTEECAYRTPVIGSDLEIAATGRILAGTPAAVVKKGFLGLQLRSGGGGKLELRVFPAQKKVQIAKVTEEGIHYLAIKKNVAAVQPPEKANVLRLRVVSGAGEEAGICKIGGYLGGEPVIEASDEACGEIDGEATALSAGAPNNGSGLIAGFEAIVVRTPVRF